MKLHQIWEKVISFPKDKTRKPAPRDEITGMPLSPHKTSYIVIGNNGKAYG
jgi:hypothetical protein